MNLNLTIAITSFNRKKYLQALIKSLEPVAMRDSTIQLVVVDNGSTELGLKEYLRSVSFIDDLVLSPRANWINDEYIAKNTIISLAKNDVILFLQDDRQFIGTYDFLCSLVSDFRTMDETPLLIVDAVRRSTNHNKLDLTRCLVSPTTNNKYYLRRDNHFGTTGFFKASIFEELGEYPTDWPIEKQYWGRSEDFYDKKVKEYLGNKIACLVSHVPIITPIWDDSRGGAAFIRGDKRYGEYNGSYEPSGLYYRLLEDEDITELMMNNEPASFVEVSHCLGWSYKRDNSGDQMKYGQSRIVEEENGVSI